MLIVLCGVWWCFLVMRVGVLFFGMMSGIRVEEFGLSCVL